MTQSRMLQPGETFDAERLYEPREAVAAYFDAVSLPAPQIETAALESAVGRILARDAVADARYPADPRSTMDGFAIVAGDGVAARRIVGEIRMGHAPPGPIAPGEAMRIPTGGVLPDGADAVIPIEDVDDAGAAMTPREAVEPGENFTPAGEDMEPGDRILRAGARIGGPELAVLATLGIAEVPVYRRPRVAIISTGDELVPAGERPGRGQVRDSNRWALAGALTALGATPVQRPVARDTFDELREAIAVALAGADAVVLTGGSSVGVRDLTPRVIEALGKPGVVVHGLKVKPGKPTVLAMVDGKPVIGLPGNPASSLMILEAVVAPIFSALAGEGRVPSATVDAVTVGRFSARPGWTWYVPVELRPLDGGYQAAPIRLHSSHTTLLARAHGYLPVGPEVEEIPAGTRVAVRRFLGGGRALP
jgi:molybdenum cofactor synthesis domain-containing protein